MKDAVAEGTTLIDWNDASFALYVENQWNLIKARILRGLFATICSRKASNRTPWVKSGHKRVQQMKHVAYNTVHRTLINLPSMCTKPRVRHSHAS